MTLVRYNPLNDFVPATFASLVEGSLNNGQKPYAFVPKVDVFKNDKQFDLHFFVPGVKKGDFTIDLEENRLTISGSRKLNKELEKQLQKSESNYGEFKRSFKLSDNIDQGKIKANYEDGILKIELPLLKKAETKKVISVK